MAQALEWLPAAIRTLVENATRSTLDALGEQLRAICLVGAAAGPNRNYRGGAELLVIADDLSREALESLALALAPTFRGGLQVRVLTQIELLGSVDVQALEIAEWQARNVVLAGEDPFAALTISPVDLRHELERALRGLSHRLRNRVLWCLATDQRHLDTVLREGLDRLTTIGYHTLALRGQPLPLDEARALACFIDWAGGEPTMLEPLRQRLLSNSLATDALAELETLAAATALGCAMIDDLAV